MTKTTLSTILVLIFTVCCHPCFAVQEWNTANGSWFTANNWTPSGVPNSSLTASINNGGTSLATGGTIAAFQIDIGKNGSTGILSTDGAAVNVQGSIDIGDVEATTATGSGTFTSVGSASFSNTTSLNLGIGGIGDLNVGQTSAGSGATANGTGTLMIDAVTNVSIPNDLDVGQTSGTGTANGMGTAALQDVTGILSIGGDLDIGQTSSMAGGVNNGRGEFTTTDVNQISIGADLDVAQATGDGQSTATATLVMDNLNQLTIADSLDVSKIRAFNSGNHSATSNVTIGGGDVLIGFGTATPGSIEISRVLTTQTGRGVANSTLTFDDATIDVANDVIVGELALGGTNSGTSAMARLNVIDSKLDTRDLVVANRLDATAGSVSGTVDLRRSLAVVQGTLMLSANSTLVVHIDGTTRAIGDGLVTDYSAIDADLASLDGSLEIEDHAGYAGPAMRGDRDSFLLISSAFGMTGSFDDVTYNGSSIGMIASYVGETQSGLDGLFSNVSQTSTEFRLEHYLAIPGDANGDGLVDASDFNIWNSNKFASGTNWNSGDFNGDGITDASDFNVWNSNKFTSALTVPEASGIGLMATMVGLMGLSIRPRNFQCRP